MPSRVVRPDVWWRGFVVSAAVVASVLVGCSSSTQADPSQEAAPSLDDLAAGSSGYEIETVLLGTASGRRALIEASPVGSKATVDVVIESSGSWVSAKLLVVVDRSAADGSTDTLVSTLLEASALDPLMAESLSKWVGSELVAVRGVNHVVSSYGTVTGGEGGESVDGGSSIAESQTAFWVEQLLQAPVAFGGPLPVDALGQGSVWEVTFLDAKGNATHDRHTLDHLDGNAYRVSVEALESDRDVSIVLEGTIGSLIPGSQVIQFGDAKTTVTVVG